MRTRTLLLIAFTLISVLLFAQVSFGQAETVGRDTTIMTLSRGNFASAFHKGSTLSLSAGLFGRLNVGYTETHWSLYHNSHIQYWWIWFEQYGWSEGSAHSSRSGYVEYLALRKSAGRFSLDGGISALAGTDAGGGLGSYYGFGGMAYSNFRVNRFCTVNLKFGQLLILPSANKSSFLQSNGGAGLSFKTRLGMMVSGMVEEAGGVGRYGVTTVSFGLSYLMPR
jgi:hypothetical protein